MFPKRVLSARDESSRQNRQSFKTPKKVLFKQPNENPECAQPLPCSTNKRVHELIATPAKAKTKSSSVSFKENKAPLDITVNTSPFKKMSLHSPAPVNLLTHWSHRKAPVRTPLKNVSNHMVEEFSLKEACYVANSSPPSSPPKSVIRQASHRNMNHKKSKTLFDFFPASPAPSHDASPAITPPMSLSPLPSTNLCRFKKSFSMCTQEDDFVFGQKTTSEWLVTPSATPLAPSSDTEENGERCRLPFVETGRDALKRISAETLKDLIHGRYDDVCDEKYVVDCRFPYEYEGGHISTAININTMERLEEMFFGEESQQRLAAGKRVIIVFHCEFSSHRAPRMALHLRKYDRNLNMQHYPRLYYPEIYILKGGYKEFFHEAREVCHPCNYVEMNDGQYRHELRKELSNFRKSWKRTKSFSGFSRLAEEESKSDADSFTLDKDGKELVFLEHIEQTTLNIETTESTDIFSKEFSFSRRTQSCTLQEEFSFEL